MISSITNLKIEETSYECDICKDKGYILDEHGNFKEYCKCYKKQRAINLLEKSGLEHVYKHYTFEGYETTEEWQKNYKQRTMKFLKQPSNAFVFLGSSGIGKTHLMTALTVHLIGQGKEALYVKWVNEMSKAKNNYWKMSPRLLERMRTVEVLYLDDFLKGTSLNDIHKDESRFAMDIIDARYNNPKLITIVSSEWSLGQLGNYNTALTGRLVEMCGGIDSDYLIDAGYKKNGNYRLKGR